MNPENNRPIADKVEQAIIEQAKKAYPFDDASAVNHRIAYRKGMREVLLNPSKYGLSPAKDEQGDHENPKRFPYSDEDLNRRDIGQRAWIAEAALRGGDEDEVYFQLNMIMEQFNRMTATPSSTVASDEVIKEAIRRYPINHHYDEVTPKLREAFIAGASLTAHKIRNTSDNQIPNGVNSDDTLSQKSPKSVTETAQQKQHTEKSDT